MRSKTKVRVKFHPAKLMGCPGRIEYWVICNRDVKKILTEYEVYLEEWDEKMGMIVSGKSEERSEAVRVIMGKISRDVERIEQIVCRFKSVGCDCSSEKIVEEFQRIQKNDSFFHYVEEIICRHRQMRRWGTANNYSAALNSFRCFRKNVDVSFEMIDKILIGDYGVYLKSRGLVPNSISFYMRILRAVYNRAVEQGLTLDSKPFKDVFTGREKTRKRAISLDDVRRIKELNLLNKPHLAFARDMFLFLFYCRGMSFVDAVFLKKADVRDGVLVYRRQKTRQLFCVKVVCQIQEIVGRYSVERSPYLLSVISMPGKEERKQYEAALRRVNNALKQIGRMLGLSMPLTTYVARHAWATIAKTKNVPVPVISEALGHNSIYTTQIYLASLDASIIDMANELVIKDL